MKKLAVLAAIILIFATQAMAIEEELTITSYAADYSVQCGINVVIDSDTGSVSYVPFVTIRDQALSKTIAAWTNPNPADPATMDLAGVVDGATSWKGTAGTDLKAAYLAALQAGFKVVGVVQTANKLAQLSMASVKLYKSTDGSSIASPGVPTVLTFP